MAGPLRERRQRARRVPPGLQRLLETLEAAPGTRAGRHAPRRHRPRTGPAPAARCAGAASTRPDRRRRRRHGARPGAPHTRPPRGPPRPARLRAGRRPRARARRASSRADAGAPGAHPRVVLRIHVEGETLPTCSRAARDVQRDDRLRDRAHRRPRAARVAAAGDRVGPVPAAASRTSGGAATRARRGRGLRAVPAARVPRPEAVLARGPRRAGADARRGDRARRGGRRARGRDRHGAPRPPQRARPHGRPPVRGDPARVRGRADDRGRDADPEGGTGDVKYHLGTRDPRDGERRDRRSP